MVNLGTDRLEVIVEGLSPHAWDVVVMANGKEYQRYGPFTSKAMADYTARACLKRAMAVAEKYWGKLEPKR
jgi:hypothetical protein